MITSDPAKRSDLGRRSSAEGDEGPPARWSLLPQAPGSMQFRYPKLRGRLFTKYVTLFAAVVCVALLTNGLSEIWFLYQDHKSSLLHIQQEQAEGASAKISQFLQEIEAQLGWTTQLPWTKATLEQRRIDLMRLLRQVPAITELVQIDPAGI